MKIRLREDKIGIILFPPLWFVNSLSRWCVIWIVLSPALLRHQCFLIPAGTFRSTYLPGLPMWSPSSWPYCVAIAIGIQSYLWSTVRHLTTGGLIALTSPVAISLALAALIFRDWEVWLWCCYSEVGTEGCMPMPFLKLSELLFQITFGRLHKKPQQHKKDTTQQNQNKL